MDAKPPQSSGAIRAVGRYDRARPSGGLMAYFRFGGGELLRRGTMQAGHLQEQRTPCVGAQYLEAQVLEFDRITALGHVPEMLRDQTANRVGGGIRQVRCKRRVELRDFGQRL